MRILPLLCLTPALVAAQVQTSVNRNAAYPPLARFVTFDKPILTVGSENSDGPTLFGNITGVSVDFQLNIYVLDYTSKSVRVFAKDGRFLGSAGRPGRGPADMSWPLSLFHNIRIDVSDRSYYRITYIKSITKSYVSRYGFSQISSRNPARHPRGAGPRARSEGASLSISESGGVDPGSIRTRIAGVPSGH
jgi:hypothetical protein